MARRSSIPGRRRGARPAPEALEARGLLAASIAGTVTQNLTATPLAGRTVFVDLAGDATLDAGDPSATTGPDGSFSIDLPDGAPTPATLRVVPYPGDVPVPASVAATPGQSAALKIQPTGASLPLSYLAAPFANRAADLTDIEVTALYRTILGREPDAPGREMAIEILKQDDVPLGVIASALIDSDEYRARAVSADYRGDLGRAATADELAAGVAALRSGTTEEQFAAQLLGSDAFDPGAPTATFVGDLYLDTLGRAADDAEVARWAGALDAGMSRVQVASSVLALPEAEDRSTEGLYAVFLGRAAEPAALSTIEGLERAGVPQSVVAVAVAGSIEFEEDALGLLSTPEIIGGDDEFEYAFGDDGILYVTDGPDIDRLDTLTGGYLPQLVIGGDLLGIDLSPDGKTLAVADGDRSGFDLVDVATGASRPIYFPAQGVPQGSYSVAWGADGDVYVTAFGTNTPLRRYDPATGAFDVLIPSIDSGSWLGISADRETIGISEDGISNGPVDVYSIEQGAVVARFQDQKYNYIIASNAAGTEFAVPTYGGAYILDLDGDHLDQKSIVASGGALPIGIAYSPTSHYLFTAEGTQLPAYASTGVKVYDATDDVLVATLDPYKFTGNGNVAGQGLMRVSPDGKLLAVSENGTTRVYNVAAYS